MSEPKHLLIFDGYCGLCQGMIQFILKEDTEKRFAFASLQGKSAALMLKEWRALHPKADTLVLIENYPSRKPHIYAFGKGALRICWLLGGWWKMIGLFSFLPPFLYNWLYRFLARRRFWWRRKKPFFISKSDADRFLS